jgi:hypothetical protein
MMTLLYISVLCGIFFISNDLSLTHVILLFFGVTIKSIAQYKKQNQILSLSSVIPPLSMLYYTLFSAYFLLGGARIMDLEKNSVNTAFFNFVLFLVIFELSVLFATFTKFNFPSFSGIPKFDNNFIWYLILAAFLILYLPALILADPNIGKEARMVSGTSIFQSFIGGTLLPYAVIQIGYIKANKRLNLPLFGILLTVGVLAYFRMGERDVFVYPLVITFLIYTYFSPISLKKLISFVVSLLIIFYFLGLQRSLSEGIDRKTTSVLQVIQENEFISTGRNFAFLMDKNESQQTIIYDISYSFFLNLGDTGVTWFGDKYYENKGLGIISEFYINFGRFAPLALFVLFYILNFQFKLRNASNLKLAVSSVVFLSILYALRSDLASISNGYVRKILIPLFLYYMIFLLCPKKN